MTKKHKRLLKAYEMALRLYPKNFHEAYAEQIFLTAEDTLQGAHTRGAVAKVVGRLIMDLLVTMVKENSKQLGGKIMKQAKSARRKSKRLLTLQALQLLGIGFVTYIWLSFAFINFNGLRRINVESFVDGYIWTWVAELIAAAILLLFVPLAFAVLHKTTSLSLWRKTTWSYGLGLLATACYLFVTYITNTVSINLTSQHHDYEWLLGLLFLSGYYLTLRKFQEHASKLALHR